jgi:LacI family transcriptional regulator
MERAEPMVSVKDVAEAAGVSLGTVSNVLNRPERVSPATRRLVEVAMVDLGFVRNESARQLRGGKSKTLAYVVLDAANPFFTDVASGAEDVAARNDYTMYLCNSHHDLSREQRYLNRLEEQRVAGVLLTPLEGDDLLIRRITKRGTPVVLVERASQDGTMCSVAVDNVAGGRLAVEHLVGQGHTRIAFVGGPDSIPQAHERYVGARAAVTDAGLDDGALLRIETEDLTVADGRLAGERLAGIPGQRRPTAAFCANDLLALGLLQQCVSLGLDVPGEMAIVGYDDIDFAAAAAVPLTSVRQPRRMLGRTAARLLLDEATNPDHRHEQVVFTPELVARASTRRNA